MSNVQAQVLTDYHQKIKEVSDQIDQTNKLIEKLSFFRIGLFLAEILLFVLLLNSADDNWRTLVQFLMIIPVAGFIFIVRRQSKLDRKVEFEKQLLWVYQNEWNILSGIENGYDGGNIFETESHPYTSDLDIFGSSSLFGLINRCNTKTGIEKLAANFSQKNSLDIILERQSAIKEMALKIKETFDFRANLHGHDVNKIEQIKEQLKHQLGEQLAFTRHKFFRFYVTVVPFISIALILGSIFIGGIFIKLLVLVTIIHTGWNVILNPKVNKVFYCFGGGSNLLNGYARAIRWTEKQSWKSTYILNLFKSKVPVSEEIKSLSKIIQNFDARLNLLVGGVLNALLLWDFKCCISLDKWYQASSSNVVSALNNLGYFEEIISFATLTHNSPDWIFPEIKSTFSLSAKSIGHPLISKNYRVVNDFQLEQQPTVDIVTGSNMAGKSTFLRTLGINMVLAYSGAPVCASEMSLSVFALNTYMRIKDSLNESTSTFKAELNRLKMILNHVVTDKDTFVLIDEMLRGTNSKDKYLGSKVFIEKLIAMKTPALFATHDLQLSELKETYITAVRNYHFDIQISQGEMNFDYKIKNGPCKTFNAAILLKEIGLSLD
ncbi:MutS-related protein [Pedobacter mucosus]|uniref:MutS-related protein n=1 Tax=Pedobacter mucosus TaxID=2895286 RepID=UPI001EE3BCCD|nr:DNA mismatch repair protein MutS [Pedobacter mucosus]UKT62815.1 DNA mismatch repair protein MutS [Pedobacter mucosus]